jgi:hypothetical protein
LQRQAVPKRKAGRQPNVDRQYPCYPQNGNRQCRGQKSVCRAIGAFAEPQLQGESEADEYHSQEGQVIQGDME